MLKTIGLDGPDYGGKSTLAKLIHGMLNSAGVRATIVNHPTTTTEPGQRARNLVGQRASNGKIAQAICEDFLHTMEVIVPQYEVTIFDRFCPSTIAYQGVDGKGEVFRSKVANHPNAPQLYVAIDVDYATAMERFKQRVVAQGKSWDDEVLTARYLQDEKSWDALRESYRFAHHIVTEGGEKYPLINVVSDDDIALHATRIVEKILAG